ncbi:MAG: hypothetical protein C0509_07980, partial [Acinetobacter sp.]|nr:hypothetical protein [Acinetobacter sp.]
MAQVSKISNVAVDAQSALATAINITSITKAAPGVVTAANTFANGDAVFLNVSGMTELNNRVFRVVNVAAGNFQLEAVSGGGGIDTTGFGTFVSGTVQKITFGVSLTSVSGIDI